MRRYPATEHHFVGHVGYVVFALFNLLSDSANESESLNVDNEENTLLPQPTTRLKDEPVSRFLQYSMKVRALTLALSSAHILWCVTIFCRWRSSSTSFMIAALVILTAFSR